MKYISSLFTLLCIALAFSACEKAEDLPYYDEGKAVTLTASSTALTPAPADSGKTVLTLSWTNPEYPFDASKTKYTVQLDVAGNNFSDPITRVVRGKLDTTFTGAELNAFATNHFWEFNKSYNMEARVIASYENNNDQQFSNVVALKYTPYKVPPKVALPETGHLYLVGNINGWSNPVAVPELELAQIDETTFGGIFHFSGGGEYLILPVNGSWDQKYAIRDNNVPGAAEGGDFGKGSDEINANFPAPAEAGWYKIVLDFQHGKYTVTPWTGEYTGQLFIVGGATPGDWSNPVPVPSQQFTRLNSAEFELNLEFKGGSAYLLLPVNGSWDHKYSVRDETAAGLPLSGAIGYNLPKDIPGPAEAGMYKIHVNFAAGNQGTIRLTKQ